MEYSTWKEERNAGIALHFCYWTSSLSLGSACNSGQWYLNSDLTSHNILSVMSDDRVTLISWYREFMAKEKMHAIWWAVNMVNFLLSNQSLFQNLCIRYLTMRYGSIKFSSKKKKQDLQITWVWVPAQVSNQPPNDLWFIHISKRACKEIVKYTCWYLFCYLWPHKTIFSLQNNLVHWGAVTLI